MTEGTVSFGAHKVQIKADRRGGGVQVVITRPDTRPAYIELTTEQAADFGLELFRTANKIDRENREAA